MNVRVPEDFTIYRAADERLRSLLNNYGVLGDIRQVRDRANRRKDSALSDTVQFAVKEKEEWAIHHRRRPPSFWFVGAGLTVLSITLRVKRGHAVSPKGPAELEDPLVNYIGQIHASEIEPAGAVRFIRDRGSNYYAEQWDEREISLSVFEGKLNAGIVPCHLLSTK